MKTDSLLPETVFFFPENDTVLSKEERDSIEGLLTELEGFNALKHMEPEKAPAQMACLLNFTKCFGVKFRNL